MIRTLTYSIHDVAPYINWSYFFHAWGFPAQMTEVSRLHGCDACRAGWLAGFPEMGRGRAAEALQLFKDAQRMLSSWDEDFHTYARFALFASNAEGDDLILYTDKNREDCVRLPLLRQQHPSGNGKPCLCLADFVRPVGQGKTDTVGLFATTVDSALEHLYEEGDYADNFKHLLAQTLADRLAEATAEKMHEEIRIRYWGYAPDEQLSMEELHTERFAGIRPAIGYPSLPDQSVNFLLDEWLDFNSIDIRLTENGAMIPHASVSGLMLSHPQARYFSVGKIGDDQLEDYALRRGVPVETMRKFLISNL